MKQLHLHLAHTGVLLSIAGFQFAIGFLAFLGICVACVELGIVISKISP